MKLLQLLTRLLKSKKQGLAWWAEITTRSPHCIYYFGPFSNPNEANVASVGYIEDLEGEAAKDIVVVVKYCQPKMLTIFNEETD